MFVDTIRRFNWNSTYFNDLLPLLIVLIVPVIHLAINHTGRTVYIIHRTSPTWKYGITRDLHELRLRGRLPTFIENFLGGRSFRVRVGTTLSDVFNQEQGVPQGSILSVTLFIIQINSIVNCIKPGTDCSLFVDDFNICYGVERAASPWPTLGIRSCRTFYSDLAW